MIESKPRILHMLTPGDNVSPFDVNMAADAGFGVITPYSGVNVENISAYVQDAIFSRPPGMHNYTAAFIGGWDVNMAADMLHMARQAIIKPFEISVFADPNGAFTTAAALVALSKTHLQQQTGSDFAQRKVLIFGGGPVGICAGVLIALQGGKVQLVRLTRPSVSKQALVTEFADRYGVELPNVDGQDDRAKRTILADAEVVITTAKAGIQVLSEQLLNRAAKLLLAVDVNAVPPTGVEGLQTQDNGTRLTTSKQAIGIGALAIGKVKYNVQHGLFKYMLSAEKAVFLDLPDAYQMALQQF